MKIPCSKIQIKIIIVASAVVGVDYQQMRFDWPDINSKMAVSRLILGRSLVSLKL
jgi:hypothetical protein